MKTPTITWNIKGEPIPEGYIPAVEAAGLLGITQNALYDGAKAGVLPKPREGQFYRPGKDGEGQNAYPCKYVWDKQEILEAATTARKQGRPPGKQARAKQRAPMPDGYIRAEMAAELLGVSCPTFHARVRAGFLPAGTSMYITGAGHKAVHLWKKEALLPYVPKPAEKANKLSSTAQAILSRLRAHADASGYVNGDATDIIFGFPMREKDRADVDQLIAFGIVSQSRDNWHRRCFQLSPESEADRGSKEWRSF